jgi:hypothetical protein
LLSLLDGFSTIGGFAAYAPLISLFEQLSQRAAHEFAVIYNEDANGRSARAGTRNGHTSTYEITASMSIPHIA